MEDYEIKMIWDDKIKTYSILVNGSTVFECLVKDDLGEVTLADAIKYYQGGTDMITLENLYDTVVCPLVNANTGETINSDFVIAHAKEVVGKIEPMTDTFKIKFWLEENEDDEE